MLETFRRLAGTWPARVLFFLLAASFVAWGVANRGAGGGGGAATVATVAGEPISTEEFAAMFQRQMAQTQRMFPDPSQMPPGVREQAAQEALTRVVSQKAIEVETRKLGVVAPDAAVRDAVFARPEFQGAGGFDRATFLQLLASNHMTEARYLGLMRADIAQNQLLGTLQATAEPSPLLVDRVWRFLHETRQADIATVPFAGQAPPPTPATADLQRYYDNNHPEFTTPELRRVKVVVLSPQTIARSMHFTDKEIAAWFDQHKAEFTAPEKRSIQVITTSDAKSAAVLAAKWRGGADWTAMQAAAKAAGASSTAMADATVDSLPSPELAKAAFAAKLNDVTGPVAEPLGQQVLRVTAVTAAANPTADMLKDLIRERLGLERASDVIDARAQKLQDLFAGGSTLDEVPADIGALAASGTLDARGVTPEGQPAPLPATGALRQQIIGAAFEAAKDEPPRLVEGPDQGWYAVQVTQIDPPALQPFDAVRARVLAAWQKAQIRHRQDVLAGKLIGMVKAGQSLTQAVWGTGVSVQHVAKLTRDQPPPGVPANLAKILFINKPGDPAMVETNDGFVVGVVTAVQVPDPKADPTSVAGTRDDLRRAMGEDAVETVANALREAGNPQVNQQLVQSVVQPQ